MKITLFLDDRIVDFTLPNQISGSYRFDPEDDEVDKLINIEARNGKWVLYGTDTVFVMNNNNIVPSMDIVPNMFYTINRNKNNYIIYFSSVDNRVIQAYMLPEQFSFTIGNGNSYNLSYSTPFINQLDLTITRGNNAFLINSNLSANIYVDNNKVNTEQSVMKYCSTLNIMGIKIMFLEKLMILNYPSLGVTLNNFTFQRFSVQMEEYQNIIVKDIDLYDSNNYFSKSPRIRRLIEEKPFSFDGPPKLKDDTQKTPLILTLGPMLSLLASSGISLLNTVIRINEGATTFKQSWMSFATCGVMLVTSFLWPLITKAYNKRLEKKNNEEIETKYKSYLADKEKELQNEANLQRSILFENLLSCKECLDIVRAKKNNFWCKRKDQNDFLQVRVGIGKVPLAIKVTFPKEGFTLEEDKLKKIADDTLNKYKELDNVPVGYSLFENYLTAVMGPKDMCNSFINNLVFQLCTFYCYDEIKFIVFTNERNKSNWEYLKYSKYCFSNNMSVRYYATNNDEYKELGDYLIQELQYRLDVLSSGKFDPKSSQYYIIICDNYKEAKKLDFFKKLVEAPSNVGYSTIFIDNRLSNLPSKCVNFITLNRGVSGILNNSYESATVKEFKEEISDEYNMDAIMRELSNVPVEIKDEDSQLPNSIGFLEMEKVGKVEQLNILNRWSSNDSVKSLKAEVGVDVEGDLLYLDLHEKVHGPHGLIAGMTGSGKSEFIISYILSMAMNYSPDDVSFVLIDYKGGGLAGAFLNETNNIRLPHLSGTITNLDKAEMNRTLVSIDSEVKRRQKVFNEARDALAESTIDIYKYQDFYHQGKLKEPIPHLFIISDEFAELKSQQPDFMDNLISVARIGRSLGVHLILATQKPSGVVNDQIWSNSKFKVCLKVQDASDSNEMLKRPDAASLKQTGRFYLQVGYDEYFVLGQSAWSGAKYFPAEKTAKTVDKSLNIINDIGAVVKSIEDDSSKKVAPQGDQIGAILGEIINVAKQTNKYAKTLWLEKIPAVILVDNLMKKYGVTVSPYNIEAVIGEYDAPELQKQGIVKYNLLENGNTLILGTDGSENEMMLNSIVYSIANYHSSEEVNFYFVDYGSESLRIFGGLPHLGGIVAMGDDEKYTNLINMMKQETTQRKEMFINYGGEYKNYLRNSGKALPLKVVIINNFDAVKANIQTINDDLPELVRDSERYGIIYIITANGTNSVGSKISQNFSNAYCLHLKDAYDYSSALGVKTKLEPNEIFGRGICAIDGAHEFQTASIVDDTAKLSDYILNFVNQLKAKYSIKAKRIPALPQFVLLDDVSEKLKDLTQVPIGIAKSDLEIVVMNMLENVGNLVVSNKLDSTREFASSILQVFRNIQGTNLVLLDAAKTMENEKMNVHNYYNDRYEDVLKSLNNYFSECINGTKQCVNMVVVVNSMSKMISKIDDKKILDDFIKNIKKLEKIAVIVFDEALKIKSCVFDSWYKELFASQEGIWIGSGVADQSVLKISSFGKEFRAQYKNNMGFYISNGNSILVKLLDFNQKGEE